MSSLSPFCHPWNAYLLKFHSFYCTDMVYLLYFHPASSNMGHGYWNSFLSLPTYAHIRCYVTCPYREWTPPIFPSIYNMLAGTPCLASSRLNMVSKTPPFCHRLCPYMALGGMNSLTHFLTDVHFPSTLRAINAIAFKTYGPKGQETLGQWPRVIS